MPRWSDIRWFGFSLQRAVLLFILLAAAIFGVYYILSKENARRASRPEIPGLDDIDECGSLTSFDGTKTIDFDRAHKIVVTEKSSDENDKSERKVSGTWSYDEENERYTVQLENTSVEYELVKPENSSVCILAPGDIAAVNLNESWFGHIEEKKEDDEDEEE
jgi:hypothetical protein